MQQKKVFKHLGSILSLVESQEIIDNVGRDVFGRKFWIRCWDSCMRDVKCSVEFDCQLCIWCRTEKDYIKTWLRGRVEELLGFILTSGLQVGFQIRETFGRLYVGKCSPPGHRIFSFRICQMEDTIATYFSVPTLHIKILKYLRTFYRLILYDIKNNMAVIRSFSKSLSVWWLQLKIKFLSWDVMYLYLRILYKITFIGQELRKWLLCLPILSIGLPTHMPSYLPTYLPTYLSVFFYVYQSFSLAAMCLFKGYRCSSGFASDTNSLALSSCCVSHQESRRHVIHAIFKATVFVLNQANDWFRVHFELRRQFNTVSKPQMLIKLIE
jgi:hypothetical protein